jgi:hypothetical protein
MTESSLAVEPTPPSKPVESPKKGINLKIIIPVVVLIVILGAFGYSYYTTSGDLKTATDSTLQTIGIDYKISNLSLIPPGADLTVLANMNNPSTLNLDLSFQYTMFYNNTVLVPMSGSINLPAGKSDVLTFTPIHIGSEAITKLNDKSRITTTLTVVATTKVWGLIPVSYTKTGTNLAALKLD